MARVNNFLYVGLIVLAIMAVVFMNKLHSHFNMADPGIWFGVETVELTPDIKKQYDIQSTNGLLVSRIFMGSAAQEAGIKEGDVIRRWNGISVMSQEKLQYLIQVSRESDRITIVVDRQNKPFLIYAWVEMRPSGI